MKTLKRQNNKNMHKKEISQLMCNKFKFNKNKKNRD